MNVAKAFYRTVVKNEIHYFSFEGEKNERKEGDIVMYGDAPVNILEMRLRKELKNSRVIIDSVKQFEIYCKIGFETLLENAEIIRIKERN